MKINDQQKQFLIDQYRKVWHNNQKMIDYCVKKVAAFVEVQGRVVVFDKPSIQTHFCFGERGYDYDEVQHTCQVMSEDEQYFISENLRYCDLTRYRDLLEDYGMITVTIDNRAYWNQDDDCVLGNLHFYRPYEEFESSNEIPLTGEDVGKLKVFLDDEINVFKKRLNTYLKRYGLSKCSYWTYWMDA